MIDAKDSGLAGPNLTNDTLADLRGPFKEVSLKGGLYLVSS